MADKNSKFIFIAPTIFQLDCAQIVPVRARLYFFFLNEPEKGMDDIEYSITLRPTMVRSCRLRAEMYYRTGEIENALLGDFKKAIELDPHHFKSYLMLDYSLMATRDWDRIIGYWNRLIELEANNDRAYLERVGTCYHKKEYQKSLADLKRSCDLGNKESLQVL